MEIPLINVHLDTVQWIQSILPVNFGVVGIRSFLETSFPPYLASVNGLMRDIVSNLISTLINIYYISIVPKSRRMDEILSL